MRTTINLSDDLYDRLRERARRDGRTVTAELEDAVRLLVDNGQPEPREPFRIEPFGRGGVQPGVDLTSNAALQELLDADGFR